MIFHCTVFVSKEFAKGKVYEPVAAVHQFSELKILFFLSHAHSLISPLTPHICPMQWIQFRATAWIGVRRKAEVLL